MSEGPERRRRRIEDDGEEVRRPSECESEGESHEVGELSEYESAADESSVVGDETEDNTASETEEGECTDSEEGSETETEGGYSDEEGLGGERQSGDGEEQPEDKVDDDEDKKNPAYVPRRGAFYEHDYRMGDEGGEGEEEEKDLQPKKKLWQDDGKWGHDCYNEEAQTPKSREELTALYGYDIRAADKPPEQPPKRMGTGRGRGRRGGDEGGLPRRTQQMQDFMPRMAVIDTTDFGSDSIPNLDEDGFYSEGVGRGRSSEKTRRPMGRGRGTPRGHDNSSSNKAGGWSQDPRNKEYPSLAEINRQTERFEEERRDKNRYNSTQQNENRRNNHRQELHTQEERPDSYRKQERPDSYRKPERPDSYRKEDRQEFGNRQHTNDNDRRGGYNNRRGDVDQRSQQAENSSGDARNQGYDSRDPYGRNNNNQAQNSSYGNRQAENQRADSRSQDVRNTNTRGGFQSHDQQVHSRQQHARNGGINLDSPTKEFTSSSYKTREERVNQRDYEETGMKGGGVDRSKNVVISNKENVQTINVTITTTEKKSYAKERRGKAVLRSEEGQGHLAAAEARPVTTHSKNQPPSSAPEAGQASKRYSSQRQGTAKGNNFTGPPPLDSGAKLYNPALPPPPFYQREAGGVPRGPPRSPQSGTVEAPTFPPPLLPPAAYGLQDKTRPSKKPLANPAMGIPRAVTTVVPAGAPGMFPVGPPPPTALIAPPYIPAGMVYQSNPRVPPPGTPAGFHVPLAYTQPPPAPGPPTTVATPPSQPPASQTAGAQSDTQQKKVYRGDITYYAPELQPLSRGPQKRPKAAIPIVDPQVIRQQKQKQHLEQKNSQDTDNSINLASQCSETEPFLEEAEIQQERFTDGESSQESFHDADSQGDMQENSQERLQVNSQEDLQENLQSQADSQFNSQADSQGDNSQADLQVNSQGDNSQADLQVNSQGDSHANSEEAQGNSQEDTQAELRVDPKAVSQPDSHVESYPLTSESIPLPTSSGDNSGEKQISAVSSTSDTPQPSDMSNTSHSEVPVPDKNVEFTSPPSVTADQSCETSTSQQADSSSQPSQVEGVCDPELSPDQSPEGIISVVNINKGDVIDIVEKVASLSSSDQPDSTGDGLATETVQVAEEVEA